jgi:hypothetical protein
MGDPITTSGTRSRTDPPACLGQEVRTRVPPASAGGNVRQHARRIRLGTENAGGYATFCFPPSCSGWRRRSDRLLSACSVVVALLSSSPTPRDHTPFPDGDHHASNGVARRWCCPGLGHETVDPTIRATGRKVRHDCWRGDQRNESTSGHPGALGVSGMSPSIPNV